MQKSKNRLGYRMIKIGQVPKSWLPTSLRSLKHFLTSGSRGWSKYYSDTGDLFIRITNLTRESINLDYSDCRFVKLPEIGSEGIRTRLQAGDVLISITADLGIIGFFSDREPYSKAYVNQHVALLRLLDKSICSQFVAYQLTSSRSQKRFRQITDQGAKSGLNLSAIRSFPVVLPSLPEQETIIRVLNCWEKTIQKYEEKIKKKRNIKKGLMQRLLSGKQRLPGFSENWQKVTAKKVVSVKYGKNWKNVAQENGPYPVYGTGGQIGTSSEYLFNAPAILLGRKGTIDFPRYLNRPFWAVDTTFVVHCNSGTCIEFVFLKFQMIPWYKYNEASGVPSLSRTAIENVQLALPSEIEQQAIASILLSAASEISSLEKKLTHLRDQKRFFLNNLLTGQIRLPEFCDGDVC